MQQSPPVRARVSYVTAPLLALSPSISHHIPLSRFHSTLSTNPIANGFCPLHQSCRKSRRLLARDGHMIERMCLLLQKRGTFGFAAPRKHPSQCQLQFFFKKNSYFHSSFYFSFSLSFVVPASKEDPDKREMIRDKKGRGWGEKFNCMFTLLFCFQFPFRPCTSE